jgi:polysaccharide biosynthesis protein PelF
LGKGGAATVKFATAKKVDILIICEGAYPFIKGGVSAWVQQLISALSEYTFGVVFLGTVPEDYQEPKYEFPDNLIHLQPVYLFQPHQYKTTIWPKRNKKALAKIKRMHDWFKKDTHAKGLKHFPDIASLIESGKGFDEYQFLYSHDSWDYFTDMYQQYCTDPSYLDYFWTIRNIHLPIWKVADTVAAVPEFKIVHSVSTGYAGFLGALLRQRYHKPFILTEHGIYTKERRIELLQMPIVREDESIVGDVSYMRKLWIRFFESIARVCYMHANEIISLYETAQRHQIADGASSELTKIIVNGVDIEKFKPLRRPKNAAVPKVMCLIGRIVPIKDIKNFILAVNIAQKKIPDLQGWVVGPMDEDEEYTDECLKLMNTLGVEDYVKFLGVQNVLDIFPKIGVTVLTSISEGMPLVILESYAAGIPVVVTNVGACRNMVLGQHEQDQALGASGAVASIANPQETADDCVDLLLHPEKWQRASAAAIARVEQYYDEKTMFDAYREIYQKHIQDFAGLQSQSVMDDANVSRETEI